MPAWVGFRQTSIEHGRRRRPEIFRSPLARRHRRDRQLQRRPAPHRDVFRNLRVRHRSAPRARRHRPFFHASRRPHVDDHGDARVVLREPQPRRARCSRRVHRARRRRRSSSSALRCGREDQFRQDASASADPRFRQRRPRRGRRAPAGLRRVRRRLPDVRLPFLRLRRRRCRCRRRRTWWTAPMPQQVHQPPPAQQPPPADAFASAPEPPTTATSSIPGPTAGTSPSPTPGAPSRPWPKRRPCSCRPPRSADEASNPRGSAKESGSRECRRISLMSIRGRSRIASSPGRSGRVSEGDIGAFADGGDRLPTDRARRPRRQVHPKVSGGLKTPPTPALPHEGGGSRTRANFRHFWPPPPLEERAGVGGRWNPEELGNNPRPRRQVDAWSVHIMVRFIGHDLPSIGRGFSD